MGGLYTILIVNQCKDCTILDDLLAYVITAKSTIASYQIYTGIAAVTVHFDLFNNFLDAANISISFDTQCTNTG